MKVLVVYAIKRGSTAENAEAVADALQASGFEADCIENGEVADLEPCGAVVLGSAVYMKRWRGDARQSLRRHRRALAEMPFLGLQLGAGGRPWPGQSRLD